MISVDSLLYKIDQRLNKVATNTNQQIQLEDKILALNENQIKLIKKKVSGFPIGFDSNKRRYQDLQFLVENTEDHPLTLTKSDVKLNRWIAKVADVTPKFMFYVDAYIVASKGQCKDRVVYCNPDLVRHADIPLLLNNTNYKPSFEYQETIIDISSDELHVYTDGTFIPSTLYLSYIRYPKSIDKEGYIHFDGTDSVNQDCELEDYLEDELLDMVYFDLGLYTENNSAAQGAMTKMNAENQG